jgi:hypothetical protein
MQVLTAANQRFEAQVRPTLTLVVAANKSKFFPSDCLPNAIRGLRSNSFDDVKPEIIVKAGVDRDGVVLKRSFGQRHGDGGFQRGMPMRGSKRFGRESST